jgi:hypothetical protein
MRIQLRVFLVMALLAGVFTQSPGPVAPLSRAAFAAPAGGDAVTVWNAHAGVAALNACIAPLDDPFHESRIYAIMHLAIHNALNATTDGFSLTSSTNGWNQELLRMLQWRRRHAMCRCRSLVNSLASSPSSPSRASMPALQASKPPTLRLLPCAVRGNFIYRSLLRSRLTPRSMTWSSETSQCHDAL